LKYLEYITDDVGEPCNPTALALSAPVSDLKLIF
jgi:hypothetical protein